MNYTTIQGAIEAAETLDGHAIEVDAGIYYEHVSVSKSIFLLGQSRNDTIIDGSGWGPVVTLSADNVSVANFTIRNGGHFWIWQDTCIWGNNLRDVRIENNTLVNASSGIIFYSLQNSSMSHNLAEECGAMGLHFDGNSTNCKMTGNTVTDSFQGIVVEESSGNVIQGNDLVNNNVSINFYASGGNLVEENNIMNSRVAIVLDSCSGPNSFRNNNITKNSYNLIVWGSSLEAFVQDIDISNIVDGRTVYYIANSHDLTLNPTNCSDIGYLALVNCTRVAVENIDLSDDKDGMLMAESTNCKLVNVTLANVRTNITVIANVGVSIHVIYGGLTFFKSTDNLIINSKIANDTVGVCLHQSSGNLFYHNSFVNIDKPVIPNYQSPSQPPSGSSSMNKWDNDLEGNYWSNYSGTDLFSGLYQNVNGSDGIGDIPYSVDTNNTDRYPLVGTFSSFNTSSGYNVDVISNSTIKDFEYFESNATINMHVSNVTANQTHGFCRICIPYSLMVPPYRVIVDGGEPYYVNYTLYDNGTHRWIYVAYQHSTHEIIIIAEFPEGMSILILMLAVILATTSYKLRVSKRT
jgi:parallel beta-helix repeat protein